MNNNKWKNKIEESLKFELSNSDVSFINDEFAWLENRFKLISNKEYEGIDITSLPNIKRNDRRIEHKNSRNLSKKLILDNAKRNVSENNFITYPKK